MNKIVCQKIDANSLTLRAGNEELTLKVNSVTPDTPLRIGSSGPVIEIRREHFSLYLRPAFSSNTIYASFEDQAFKTIFMTDAQSKVAMLLPLDDLDIKGVEWSPPLQTSSHQHLFRGLQLYLCQAEKKWESHKALSLETSEQNDETALAMILLRIALPGHCICFQPLDKPKRPFKILMRSLKMGIDAQQKLASIPDDKIANITPSQVLEDLSPEERNTLWHFIGRQSAITEPFKR